MEFFLRSPRRAQLYVLRSRRQQCKFLEIVALHPGGSQIDRALPLEYVERSGETNLHRVIAIGGFHGHGVELHGGKEFSEAATHRFALTFLYFKVAPQRRGIFAACRGSPGKVDGAVRTDDGLHGPRSDVVEWMRYGNRAELSRALLVDRERHRALIVKWKLTDAIIIGRAIKPEIELWNISDRVIEKRD